MNEGAEVKPLVLVVDDEPQMQRLVRLIVESHGFRCELAGTGQLGLALAAQFRPSIVLLDLGLPDLPGQEVLRRLREWSSTPVVILSALDAEAEKVAALDAGADDYVTKPFNSGELLARVRVALRHASRLEEPPVFRSGRLVVDLSTHRVTAGGKEVSLTATEYALLRLFVRHSGKILTHRQILREVWRPNAEEQTHYLRVYVARLREKLEADPSNPSLVITEPGIGYRMSEREK